MPRPIPDDMSSQQKFEVKEIVIPQRKTPKKSGTLRAWRESLKRRRRQQQASSSKKKKKEVSASITKKRPRPSASKAPQPAANINKKKPKNNDNDSISLGESPDDDEEHPDEEEQISDMESDESSSDDSIEFPLIARGSQKRSQKDKEILQKIARGKAPPQFRDDKSGTKTMRPLTIRCALGIMEDEARRTAISQWRGRGGTKNKDESQRLQVRSGHHTRAILGKVREKLSDVKTPVQYTRLEDMNVQDMSTTDEERRMELRANQQLIKSLEKQRVELQQEFDDALAERDRAYQERQKTRDDERGGALHPLLLADCGSETKDRKDEDDSKPAAVLAQRRPAGESLHQLLGSLPSLHDSRTTTAPDRS